MVVLTLLGNTLAVTTPPMTVTPSGLKSRVPPTVVSRLKLVSVHPGQTQWARSLTAWFAPHVAFLGHTTLICNSVIAWKACPLPCTSLIVPLMNLGKTSTLPGCSESFAHAAAGPATPILSNASHKTRIDFMSLPPL